MKLQLTETNQEMLNLKIQLKTMMIKGNGGDEKQGRRINTFTRSRSGRRLYENNVEDKYRDILDIVKKELKLFAALEVVEMADYSKDKESDEKEVSTIVPVHSWEGRFERTGGDGSSGMLFGVGKDGENSVSFGAVAKCPINSVISNGMYTPSKPDMKNQIAKIVENVLERKYGDAFDDEEERQKCIDQISNDRATNVEFKNCLANAIGTRKKASRNRFMTMSGYTMFHTRVSRNAEMSNGQKEELSKQREELKKNCTSHVEMGEIDFGWWRRTDANELCFSELKGKEELEGIDDEDQIFSNKIGKQVYYEYMNKKINKEDDDESTIASVARLDVWILTVVTFAPFDFDKRKGLQKKYSELGSKYLPLAVQQILLNVRNAVMLVKVNELSVRMGCPPIEGDMFNNGLREITQIYNMLSLSRCYVCVEAEWFYDNISKSLASVLDCYLGMFNSNDISKLEHDTLSDPITIENCYKANKEIKEEM